MTCDSCVQASSDGQTKKLEEQLAEASRRGDDLQRTLTELSVAKNRLTGTLVLDPVTVPDSGLTHMSYD